MISLIKTVNEMERQEDLLQALKRSYWQAIRSSGEFAVEVDPQAAQKLRDQLRALCEGGSQFATPQDFEQVDDAVRTQLKGYRDEATECIGQLRRELMEAATTIRGLVEEVTTNADAYDLRLKDDVQQLNGLTNCSDIVKIRSGIQASADKILQSYEHMQRTHQLAILQMKDEIRALHQALDRDRQKQSVDTTSGAWNRQKITERMDALQAANEGFCALVVVIRNWRRLQGQSRDLLGGLLQKLLRDLQGIIKNDGVVGRWGDEVFVAILELSPSAAMAVSNQVKHRLPASYALKNGKNTENIAVETVTGIVERQRGVPPEKFALKLQQLMDALGR